MKKILCILLCLVIILSLCACGKLTENKLIGKYTNTEHSWLSIELCRGGKCNIVDDYFLNPSPYISKGSWELDDDIVHIYSSDYSTHDFSVKTNWFSYKLVEGDSVWK